MVSPESPAPIPNLDRRQLTVVAALIERDGRILIGQRAMGGSHQLKWEFPGGKIEPHESPREALRRELREELEIEAEIGGEVTRYEFQYPGKAPIQLIFFRVTQFSGEPCNIVFHDIRWEFAAEFPRYTFLDGDVDFVRRLARGEFPTTGAPSTPHRSRP